MSEEKKTTWSEVYRGPALEGNTYYQPLVTLTKRAYEMVQELCRKSKNNEVGWFGTMDVLESQVLVDDMFLLKQTVSFASVDITGIPDLAKQLMKEKRLKDVGRLHAWFHCHPGSGVSPSGTDEATYKELWTQAQGESILMGIFSKDATRAYFRLRHHGFDIPMSWRVVAPNSEITEYFPDFDEKVKTEAARVYTPGSGFLSGREPWQVGTVAGGEASVTTGKEGSLPQDKDAVKNKTKAMFASRNGRPMTLEELEALEKDFQDVGYSPEDIDKVLERAINIWGLTNEKNELCSEEERKKAIEIIKGPLGLYGLKDKAEREQADKDMEKLKAMELGGATAAEWSDYEKWQAASGAASKQFAVD